MGNKVLFWSILIFVVVLVSLGVYCFLNTQTLKFTPIAEPLTNPLMGWAPWATIPSSQQPHTLVYADLTWRQFEPQEGHFDFSSFETRNQLQRWRAEDKRVVFRFVLDKPGAEQHLDIPDWLFEKIQADGDFYDHEYGKGFSPNYANPLLISSHQKAIQALGDRYGGEDFFAYIELGSLGHWGEWHIKWNTNIRQLPPAVVRDQYVEHYLRAFPHTHLLMRRPFAIAAEHGLGLYNDMTGDVEDTNTWLGWIASGGEYSQTGEPAALLPMPAGWQVAPIGGEQTQSMSEQELYAQNLTQTILLLRASHTTFIGPAGPNNIPSESPLQPGIDAVQAVMGYRLYVSRIQLPRQVHWGANLQLKVHLHNDGIAPMYYAWPVQLYLLSEEGQILAQYPLELDVRSVLPDQDVSFCYKLPLAGLPNGVYKIGLAVLDPLTNAPVVRFAMHNARSDRIQELASFEMKRLF